MVALREGRKSRPALAVGSGPAWGSPYPPSAGPDGLRRPPVRLPLESRSTHGTRLPMKHKKRVSSENELSV